MSMEGGKRAEEETDLIHASDSSAVAKDNQENTRIKVNTVLESYYSSAVSLQKSINGSPNPDFLLCVNRKTVQEGWRLEVLKDPGIKLSLTGASVLRSPGSGHPFTPRLLSHNCERLGYTPPYLLLIST